MIDGIGLNIAIRYWNRNDSITSNIAGVNWNDNDGITPNIARRQTNDFGKLAITKADSLCQKIVLAPRSSVYMSQSDYYLIFLKM